jgi:hypothetical protein
VEPLACEHAHGSVQQVPPFVLHRSTFRQGARDYSGMGGKRILIAS